MKSGRIMKYILIFLSLFGAIIIQRRGDAYDLASAQEKAKYLYLGAEACATKCHNNDTMGYQYDRWKISLHARAFEDLKTKKALLYSGQAGAGEKPWEDMICLKCHITGAGLDASSLTPTYKREDGVTCEACHKGEFIPKTFIPKESDCLACHNGSVHAVASFDFQERCLKISHPRPKSKKL